MEISITEEIYNYLMRHCDLENDVFVIDVWKNSSEINDVYLAREKPSLHIVPKLGQIDKRKRGSIEDQFDISTIKCLLNRGIKFELNYSLCCALLMEHRKLIKLLQSYGAELIDSNIEYLLKQGINVNKYTSKPVYNEITNVAKKI